MKSSEQDDEFAPPTRRETMVPVLAVSAVAVVAVATAVMVKRSEQMPADPQPAIAQAVDQPVSNVDVVKAPPLSAPSTRSMGAAPACRECGVVQMVVAVFPEGGKQPRAYEMHIRMDDGTVRTIEQRGALAAGSRVVVKGDVVKPMS
jgi:hypothetical protein